LALEEQENVKEVTKKQKKKNYISDNSFKKKTI
jgi:hypothetical protein